MFLFGYWFRRNKFRHGDDLTIHSGFRAHAGQKSNEFLNRLHQHSLQIMCHSKNPPKRRF
jgi:hypothetical protein